MGIVLLLVTVSASGERAELPVLSPSKPVHILIPKIKVSAPFVPLTLGARGELDVPRDPEAVGWYTKSPSPGVLGPSIVAGHATWNHKPGAFFRLRSLRPGDDIRIQRADGTTAVFVVTETATYPKAAFPTSDVYGDVRHAELRLITCTGRYVADTQRYVANFVVYARLKRVTGTPLRAKRSPESAPFAQDHPGTVQPYLAR